MRREVAVKNAAQDLAFLEVGDRTSIITAVTGYHTAGHREVAVVEDRAAVA